MKENNIINIDFGNRRRVSEPILAPEDKDTALLALDKAIADLKKRITRARRRLNLKMHLPSRVEWEKELALLVDRLELITKEREEL